MKYFFAILFLFFSVFSFCSEKIFVSDFLFIDETEYKDEEEQNILQDLYDWFLQIDTKGAIQFEKNVKIQEFSNEVLYSVLDAERMCSLGGFRYVFFGYIKKTENSWFANLKLYDFETKKLDSEFFASDSILFKERFVETLKLHILERIEFLCGISPFIKEKQTVNNPYFSIGGSASYWTFFTEKWKKNLFGVVGASAFLEFYLPFSHSYNFPCFGFCLRPNFLYLYAKENENPYINEYNAIGGMLDGLFKVNLSKFHRIYAGGGIGLLQEKYFVQEKYKEEEIRVQNMYFSEAVLGYEILPTRWFSFFLELKSQFHLSSDEFVSFLPTFGSHIFILEKRK